MVSRIGYKNKKLLSNPRSQKAKTLTRHPQAAARSAGLGRWGHQMITASMDMYPPSHLEPTVEAWPLVPSWSCSC